MEDNACALENMFLAAHSFGIGSVWINQMRDICDEPEVREMLRSWEIPDSHRVFGMAALGYAAASEKKRSEKNRRGTFCVTARQVSAFSVRTVSYHIV